MEKLEGNLLIAKWMGYEITDRGVFMYPKELYDLYRPSIRELEGGRYEYVCDQADMEFHRSWGWLMPVVQKIGDRVRLIECEGYNLNECFVDLKQALCWGEAIEIVWASVIDVIKYLNNKDN